MITLIAEKPSVGMELARITGCRERKDGYSEGGFLNGQPCRVTWAIGHLCQIGETDDDKALHWKSANLPVIPKRFILIPRMGDNGKPDPGAVKQLAVIQKLFSETDTIVNCGDAGREGEVIQRYIYTYVRLRDSRCLKPVLRLWISSLTDDAIREGLRNLRPSSEYDCLYNAGRARAEADWLVGINATEALTLSVKKSNPGDKNIYSLGRVQTPTLALVCARYLENKSFTPVPFWTVHIDTESRGVRFQVVSEQRFDSYESASSLAKRAVQALLKVDSAQHKPKTVQPPLLHDQTSLQQEASRRYGMSPAEVLAIVQKLYEAKLVTYPRTGSRFIPKDVLKTVPDRIRNIAEHSSEQNLRAAAHSMSSLTPGQLNHRSVDDVKVTDHHALLVEKTAPPELAGRELKIYNLIAERMLEAFSAPCECDVFSCRFSCAGEPFVASATRIIKPGWKGVRGKEAETPEKPKELPDGQNTNEVATLPEIQDGDVLPVNKVETVRGETKPKPLYTYTSLLEAMKTAGKDSDEDEVKSAMKDIGIGTSATRAGIIKMLVDTRKYIREDGKKLAPTEKGLQVYNLVKEMAISDVALTGRWEIALKMIADGKMPSDKFDENIRTFTGQITRQILGASVGDGFAKAAQAENITCPLCGSLVKVWDGYVKCSNTECGLSANRTVFGKKLSHSAMKHLLENGKTGLVKGFVSKKGTTFDARLKLEITEKEGRKYGNARPVFDDKKPDYKKYKKG